jgi:hypothetical protein
MTATNRPLYIEQGATFTLGFNWHREGPTVDGVATPGDPYDLTGWVARMQFRKSQQAPALVSATSTDKITLGGVTGRIDVKLTDEDTDALTTRSCLYDLELESPTGDVHRLLEGAVTISPNITQDVDDPVLDG